MSQTSSPTSSALPTAARAGLVTALATWAVVVLPALVGWVSAPESSLGWWSGMAVGSAIWFLGHGQSIGGAGIAVSTTPLLLLAAFVVIAWRLSRRLLLGARARVRRSEWDGVLWRGVVPGYLLGYVIAAAVFAALTLAGSVHPDPMGIVGALLVPILGLAIALVRPGEDTTPGLVERGLAALPRWSATAWRSATRGALLLLAAGMALVLLRLVLSLGAVLRIQGEYGADVVAGIVLGVAQVAFLGNAATWGLAFLAGPGFSVAVDGLISPAAAHPGLMPLIPILGALPEDATYPGAMWAVVAVPVALGGVIAWRVDRLLGPSRWRDRVGAMAVASIGATLLVTVLTALANGAMGLERLRSVGVDVWPFAGCLLAELLGGAALWLLVALYREHAERRRSTSTPEGATRDAPAPSERGRRSRA